MAAVNRRCNVLLVVVLVDALWWCTRSCRQADNQQLQLARLFQGLINCSAGTRVFSHVTVDPGSILGLNDCLGCGSIVARAAAGFLPYICKDLTTVDCSMVCVTCEWFSKQSILTSHITG